MACQILKAIVGNSLNSITKIFDASLTTNKQSVPTLILNQTKLNLVKKLKTFNILNQLGLNNNTNIPYLTNRGKNTHSSYQDFGI